MSKFWKIVACVALLYSSVAVSVCLCVVCHRDTTGLRFDYMGIIVAIFSLLVTLLIGWNIYSVLDYKQRLAGVEKQMNIEIQSNKTENNLLFASIHKDFAKLTSDIFLLNPNETSIYTFLEHCIQAIVCYSSVSKFRDADGMILFLTKTISIESFQTLSMEKANRLRDVAKFISHPQELTLYDNLISFLFKGSENLNNK